MAEGVGGGADDLQVAPSGDGPVAATLSSSPDNAVVAVTRYAGVLDGDEVGNLVTANSNGFAGACEDGDDDDEYALPLTTLDTGSIVVAAAAMRQRTHTPGSGWAERVEQTPSDRVVTRHRLGWSTAMPVHYLEQVRKMPGVVRATGALPWPITGHLPCSLIASPVVLLPAPRRQDVEPSSMRCFLSPGMSGVARVFAINNQRAICNS